MFDDLELESYLKSLDIPESGKSYIREVRSSEPARAVGEDGYSNCSYSVYSEKMGWTIQAESTTGERAGTSEYEMDDDVIEYWDQIVKVRLRGPGSTGRLCSWEMTPDYLVLRKSGVFVEEHKADEVIQNMISDRHPAWSMDEAGVPHYEPAELFFKKIGLKFVIRPTSDFGKIINQNRKLILFSRKKDICPRIRESIVELLRENVCMTISEIMSQLDLEDTTPLLRMLDAKDIFGHIDDQLISNINNFCVSLDKKFLSLAPGPLRLLNVSQKKTPSIAQAEAVMKKIERIANAEGPDRTLRDWEKKLNEASKIGLTPFEALLPKERIGNTNAKIPPEVATFLKKSIANFYANRKRPSVKAAYESYVYSARRYLPNHPPVSEKTYRNHLKKMDAEAIALKRGGIRAGHSKSKTTDVDTRALKAQVAFEKAHIDHHLCKIWLEWGGGRSCVYAARVWVTALVDEGTAMVLAKHFSFASPSRSASACVLRECVREFGKLPEEIMSDHGPDFKSLFNRSVIGSKKITFALRPKSFPQFGSEVESLFEEFRSQWLPHRPGNIAEKREVRSVDGKFNAKLDKLLPPHLFFEEMDLFLAHRAQKLRGSKSSSAETLFNNDLKAFSFVGVPIEFDDEFIVTTAVDIKDYTIERNTVKIDGMRYSNLRLNKLMNSGKKAPVRIDPENPYTVYALVDGQWVSCLAKGAVEFQLKSRLDQMAENLAIRGAGALRFLAKNASSADKMNLLEEADRRHEEYKKSKKANAPASTYTSSHFEAARNLPVNTITTIRK
jgi:putative transposase